MTKAKIDAIESASNAIQTNHGGALLHTLARALATMMDSEANALCGADYGQRSDERSNQRNGYRDRFFETRLGTVDLKIGSTRTWRRFEIGLWTVLTRTCGWTRSI